jgi:DNA-binding response OmpR family regulator
MPPIKEKILIIEDDHITSKIYSQKFMMEGFAVETAMDGEAGILKLASFKPDIVLLDLMLPKVNGVDVLRNIRGKQALHELPVIVFSNAYLSNMVKEAWDAGATKILTKVNHSPKQVIDEVRAALLAIKSAAVELRPTRTDLPVPVVASTQSLTSFAHTNADAEFEAELRRTFLETAPATIHSIRQLLVTFTRTSTDMAVLHEFYRKIHSVLGTSALAGLRKVSKFCSALEALLKDLYQKPEHINPSTLRTLTQSIDFLDLLINSGQNTSDAIKPTNILIVDDDEIARRAIGFSLEKAELKSIAIGDATTALKMVEENQFDLIFLDIDLPDMSGFDICTRLRMMNTYKTVPIVFITSHNSTPTHARGVVSGGNDFITKPFLYMELAVKSLMLIMKSQLSSAEPGLESAN